MFVEKLKTLGLSSGEAQMYNFLLKNGDAGAGAIARLVKIGRTNVYEYAEGLSKKNLLTTYEHKRRTFFHAENPENLRELINQRVDEAKNLETNASRVIPELYALFASAAGSASVKPLLGSKGYESFMGMLYSTGTGKELYIALRSLDLYEPPEPRYQNGIAKRGLKLFLFAQQGVSFDEFNKRDERLNRETRKIAFPLAADIAVYEDKTFVGDFSKNTFSVSLITSGALSSFIRALLSSTINF